MAAPRPVVGHRSTTFERYARHRGDHKERARRSSTDRSTRTGGTAPGAMSSADHGRLTGDTHGEEGPQMSYQAYLDAIEAKTGRTPQQLLDEAAERGFGPTTKASVVLDWLRDDYALGRGHAMALYGVLKNGPVVPGKHVGSSGSHRDDSPTLRLDGTGAR
jgi:Domain of unknown function (DUF4287)